MRSFLYLPGFLLIVGVGAFLLHKPHVNATPAAKTTRYNSPEISFDYPQDYTIKQFGGESKNHTATVVELSATKPDRILTVSKDTGTATGTLTSTDVSLDFLEGTADSAFPKTYPDYHFSKKERQTIGGHAASVLTFSYTALDEKSSVYTSYAIIPIASNAYYITVQGTDAEVITKDSETVLGNMAFGNPPL